MSIPNAIKYNREQRTLFLTYADGETLSLPAQLMRVYSPSAEVRGHNEGEAVLVLGKENVSVSKIEPVGNYALKISFDDGHNTGLFSWDYLMELGRQKDRLMAAYNQEAARRAQSFTHIKKA